jgi:protein SCO1
MRTRRIILAAPAGFTAGVIAIFIAAFVVSGRPKLGAAAIGGPFTLTDDSGAQVTEAALAGKPSVIYFGYTYCPDVCPTTLVDMSHWIEKLGADADKLNFVFITVDPERDTLQVMHQYVSSFDKHIRGFTGTPDQIAKVAKEYRVYYKRVPASDGDYSMDHSSVIYLMSAQGRYVGNILYQEKDDAAVAKLRELAAGAAVS